ncbi:BREX-1 system phosphatase PglZ type A [Desulfogranum mediterraneum]|uniref:BREX-1 system phosphatase PglZ type A n=1 Tax=Desulfogranum mediterraneum TaxID=160661 RepID=UPI0004105874|nr:BREX-1 system phosphatase PglZ type A [Desulfogranum mediterraneum]
MNDRIGQALRKLFERHRIVFWYDAKQELRNDFEALILPGIEKVDIRNNEYGIKYRLLCEEPEQKFLLYHEGPQPADLDNWLLDLQLGQGEFRTDQVAIWLSELDLDLDFVKLVAEHAEFFRAIKRKEALKKLLLPDDTRGSIRLKMLAVCTGSEPLLDSVVGSLLQEYAAKRDEKIKMIGRCGLNLFLWEQVSRCYGYTTTEPGDEPGVGDFVIELFQSCYAMATDGTVRLTPDALVFLKRWKDSRQLESSFEILSGDCAEVLGIKNDIATRDFRQLLELDYFRCIDDQIIYDLVTAVTNRTVSGGGVALWVRQRRQSHWHREYHHLYEAVDFAAQFIDHLAEATLSMESLADGIQRYIQSWYKLDQLYRKHIYHVRASGQTSLLGTLAEQIENLYSNNYLLKVNDYWQTFVDEAGSWAAQPIPLQKTFFERWVRPFLKKGKKICVIISDGMRYEVGNELLSRIRQEDRYGAELAPMLSMLPSYTQLGMAALLPNTNLMVAENQSGTVLVDGLSSQGTTNRAKILQQALSTQVTAVKADELMALKGDECRALVRDHDVIYVYHNRIDGTGDKRESEERVFAAVEETLEELVRLIKKLTGANASNLLVTSDHGFIYQNRAIDESDFSGAEVEGKQILVRDRRFVLGRGLQEASGLRAFTSSQLGLAGDIEVQIPKSINRLRQKGSGSRYVHGGASLQEVVLPVLTINKKRQSDVTAVEVEIIRGSSSVITSGQLAVALYQAQPATDKVQSRTLRAGIYTETGELISDSHDLHFDFSSENPRERELQIRMVLTRKADAVNGREVIFRLTEKHTGTSHYKEYKSVRYLMRRSFTSDFDV